MIESSVKPRRIETTTFSFGHCPADVHDAHRCYDRPARACGSCCDCTAVKYVSSDSDPSGGNSTLCLDTVHEFDVPIHARAAFRRKSFVMPVRR